MEKQNKMKRKGRIMKKTKKKKRNTEILFPLILAALCSKSGVSRRALIMKCLNKAFVSLPHFELSPILALLPSLLKFDCAEIVCKSAEIVGAASLASFEMNEKIAKEDDIVKGLVSLLVSSKRDIAIASCNAVLDLSTTLVGRMRLLEFSAIENLILCFIQKCKSPTVYLDMTLLEGDEYPILLLQGAIALINSCTIEQLEHIPVELSEKISVLLKRMWRQAHKKRLLYGTSSKCNPRDEFCISNVKTNNLVESIFRLSINYSLQGTIDFENVKRSIFYFGDVGIKLFLSDIWETSPMLIRDASKTSGRTNNIFGPCIQYLGLQEPIPSFIPSFLERIISCHAIASDELDILQVIKDIKNHLGYPITYNLDIRVVKTECGGKELHYFHERKSNSSCSLDPHILSINDISKCEEAFKEGYSIALRGLEFHDPNITAIADGLASLFGQPSAGVNMYLTPSNSQGLARHSDDHCVFVCQLSGVKRWMVFCPPDSKLPRLYECCDSSHDLEDEKSRNFDGCQQFVLKEGDVLYIPRGSPHEAVTDVDDYGNLNNAAGFSLHLTLAVEIEPPFEWEGFMHVAVYCWAEKQNALQYKSCDSVAFNLHLVSVMLLHIVIKLNGHHDLRYRKACLVGANPSCESQKSTFEHLIGTIINESVFSDAVEHLEAALHVNEDPLEHVRWMKHLEDADEDDEEEIERSKGLSILSADSRDLFDVLSQHKDITEAAFLQVKYKLCCEVEFEHVKRRYLVLLEKYRKVRKQYTNGMLALHSALRDEPRVSD